MYQASEPFTFEVTEVKFSFLPSDFDILEKDSTDC